MTKLGQFMANYDILWQNYDKHTNYNKNTKSNAKTVESQPKNYHFGAIF